MNRNTRNRAAPDELTNASKTKAIRLGKPTAMQFWKNYGKDLAKTFKYFKTSYTELHATSIGRLITLKNEIVKTIIPTVTEKATPRPTSHTFWVPANPYRAD
jgi:hypothetical protein